MANSDLLSTWLSSKDDLFTQERHSTSQSLHCPPSNMFKGDPPRSPLFAIGQHVFASSSPITPNLGHVEGSTTHDTHANTEGRTPKYTVPGLRMPANVQFVVLEVKKSGSDKNEHRYTIQPISVPRWEVLESTLLPAPFQSGDEVVRKGSKGAEVELVKESYVRMQADSENKHGAQPSQRRSFDVLGFELEEEVEVKPKVMLRIVDELNIENVVEAEKYRLADQDKGEVHFPINEHL